MGSEVLGDVVTSGSGFGHGACSERSRASPSLNVIQAINPLSEDVSFTNLSHRINVAMRLHAVKLRSTRIFEQFASAVMPQ